MVRRKISDYDLLKLIANGLNAAEIAYKFGVAKGTVSKRIKKLQERGLIELDVEKTAFQQSLTLKHVKYYKLTEKGKLEVYKAVRGGEAEGRKLPRLRGVHNVEFKMKIIKDADFWFNKEVALKNWVKKYTWIGNIYIEKTPQNIVLRFGVEDGNIYRAELKAWRIAFSIKRLLQDQAGFILDDPIMKGKPKWEIVGDPVAEVVSKNEVIATDEGMIDNTPEPGTLHFYDKEDVLTYLQLPKKIREIEQEVKRFPEVAARIAEIVAEKVAVEVSKTVVNALQNPKEFSQDRGAATEKTFGRAEEEVQGYA